MEHLVFILTGFGTVLAVLALLAGFLALVGRVFAARPAAAPAPAAPPPAPAAEPAVPAHHLAAIAAAVAVMTDGRGRVVRVRAAAHRSDAWARHGRAEHFAGHRVRWGWTTKTHKDPL
ncbi:OadG family transporter subunit [Azospirillum halopraeferens]|uniref:OadG family transporter subunit n=1 Tax=Azospirillum halopraeferens TaxID=34010 RepID=UPI000405A79F|nr:OadG family transporter subunit [Azospirillum halopraeferens]